MPGLIGKKIGMTSMYDADGKNIPCTVIQAGPCVVTQVKTEAKDGYNAIDQVIFEFFNYPVWVKSKIEGISFREAAKADFRTLVQA